jgi:uncharacterized membrane protein
MDMELRRTTTTSADIARTWAVLTDITTWPRWTKSMTSVERLDDGPLHVGSRARVKQPRMPMLTWQVDEIRNEQIFTWSAPSPGVRTTGVHRIVGNPDGTTRIELEIQQRGPLAGIVGWLTGARTRRYLEWEVAGLKAASESGGPDSLGGA